MWTIKNLSPPTKAFSFHQGLVISTPPPVTSAPDQTAGSSVTVGTGPDVTPWQGSVRDLENVGNHTLLDTTGKDQGASQVLAYSDYNLID